MIDELFKAAVAIEAAGISAKDWHPKFKTLPKATEKAPCIRIWLDDSGHISAIELMDADLVGKLRKYEPDNGKSFPGFNVLPLHRICKADKWTAKEAPKALGIAMTKGDFLWDEYLKKEDAEDFWTRTRKVLEQTKKQVEVLRKTLEKSLFSDETLSKLVDLFVALDINQFQKEFFEKVSEQVRFGALPQIAMVYFVDQETKLKEDEDSRMQLPKISVFLDVKTYTRYPVAHEITIERFNDLLLNAHISEDFFAADSEIQAKQTRSSVTDDGLSEPCIESVDDPVKDAYGKNVEGSENPKMAQVSVPLLGGVFLRSQAKEIPSQSRYALCEGATFTLGNETRASVKRALEWLASSERNGKTYGIAGDKELIFAYPAILPQDSCPELSLLLGAQSDDDRKFEDIAEVVIGQLKGVVGAIDNGGAIEIFSLRKMDKARTKVVYYHNTTITSLAFASLTWGLGFKNIPPLDIRNWGKGKNDKGKSFAVPVEPQTLFPVRLHRILNTVWTLSRDEVKQSKVKLFDPSTGLRILLDTPQTAQITYVTERFIAHAQTYFIALCRAKGRNEVSGLPDLDAYPGILGLLLYKLGITKENYMNESAFLLGRFLRVADEIHRLYCEVIRKKEIPPELCGSSMLTATLENPTQAIAQLCMRSAPYLKWARAYHGAEKSGLVHYWMHQWAPIADNLHEATWPARPSPEERAQIFLGYLSSFQKSEDNSTATENEGIQQ